MTRTACGRRVCTRARQVPHLTTKVTRLVLRDGGGGIVLDVVVPEEQQTRYVLDDDVLVNRIRVELHQSSAPAGNLADVASMSIERAGRADLANIDPLDRPLVYWVVSLLRFRRGCKGT